MKALKKVWFVALLCVLACGIFVACSDDDDDDDSTPVTPVEPVKPTETLTLEKADGTNDVIIGNYGKENIKFGNVNSKKEASELVEGGKLTYKLDEDGETIHVCGVLNTSLRSKDATAPDPSKDGGEKIEKAADDNKYSFGQTIRLTNDKTATSFTAKSYIAFYQTKPAENSSYDHVYTFDFSTCEVSKAADVADADE